MKEYISNSEIVNNLVKEAKLSLECAEQFIEALISSLCEIVNEEGTIDLENFGTFKIVRMAKRESVNVNNGERITIPEYNKISFVPIESDSKNKSKIGNKKSLKIDDNHKNALVLEKDLSDNKGNQYENEGVINGYGNGLQIDDDSSNDNEITHENTIAYEKPVDEFSGIDVVISTPESLDEMKQRLLDAKEKGRDADQTLLNAQRELELAKEKVRNAQDEREKVYDNIKQLEMVVDNIVKNKTAVVDSEQIDDMEIGVEIDVGNENNDNDETVNNNSFSRVSKILLYSAIAIAVIALVFIGISIFKQEDNDNLINNNIVVKHDNDKHLSSPQGSIKRTNEEIKYKRDSVDKVTFDGCIPFESIVINHYGDRRHMKEVLDYNIQHGAFKDWRNIPKGTEVLLPKFDN